MSRKLTDTLARHIFNATWKTGTYHLEGVSLEWLNNRGYELVQDDEQRKRIVSLIEKFILKYLARMTNL